MIKYENQANLNINFTNPVNIIPFIDLTSLNTDDNETSIITLCKKAVTPYGAVAAVCVYPKFIKIAKETLKKTDIKIATVVNFPSGDLELIDVVNQIELAITDGVNEIDMVFPYRAYIRGERNEALDFVKNAKKICKNNKLKIIIETGELISSELVKMISKDVILAGADFIKTSTGKTKQGATIETATAILTTIKEYAHSSHHIVGLKVSGGISTIPRSQAYIQLVCNIMGDKWIHPNVFRIGASKLLDEIISAAQ